ncbi:MAG: DUF1846 domain-containing protein [Acutalibacteraceae bacterium]|jgi:uncharacterized protein (UPF0371 family)|nr:DUF1846 domain-containing protein [Acutalibacteraceae bacterium]
MFKVGFDNDLYIQKQSEQISKRIKEFGGKLYLEFGGKLFDDYHASRVLPGFKPDSKLQMLKNIGSDVEIVIVINASDIQNNKIRRDLGITYDSDVLRLIDAFRAIGLFVGSVVIAQYKGQPAALAFKNRLENLGVRVFIHYPIEGYPYNIPHIVSEEGFGKNEYIETERPLVVITAPGPGSGKMATCLSQLYHDNLRGIKAGYAKFETFPIWNLPLKHPVNLAYEAATADLNDVNVIDPYHLEAYGKTTVNYNRDVEVFPVLNAIFEKIEGKSPYKSPTDMGVNMAGYCISDDAATRDASLNEIIRRYFSALCDHKKGLTGNAELTKIESLMNQAGVTEEYRRCVRPALDRAKETGAPAVAIELPDGRLITGKTSSLLGASSAAILNAVKLLSNQPKEQLLIDPGVIEPIQSLKTNILGNNNPRLHTDEVLIALTMSAIQSEPAKKAFDALSLLRGCEAHSSVILSQVDADVYRKLGINLTCEPHYQVKKLYHKA